MIRVLITFVLSILFGLERQRSHKPIGFGTFVFVSLGSCALSIIAIIISPNTPLPLLGAIVTGIGFLGAGALIKTTDKIFGFTTAAGIWIFSIFGLIIGIGEYVLGLIVYALIWVIILVDKYLEKIGIGTYQKKLTVTLNKNIHSAELAKIFGTRKYKLMDIHAVPKDNIYTLVLYVEGPKSLVNSIPRKLYNLKEVISFRFE